MTGNKTFIENSKRKHIKNDKIRLIKINQYEIKIIEHNEEKDKEKENINELEKQLDQL